MNETKKRCLSILSFFVLITIVFMPLASSITIKNCEEQTSNVDKESTCGGTIHGHTLESHDTWGAYPVPLALVDAGIKKTISGFPTGYYCITGLPFDQEITITASKIGYKSDTLRYTFTEKKNTYYYCFDLQEKEDDSVKEKVSNSNGFGRIYGYTVSSFAWSWNPISNVLVTTGLQGKSTISDGYYSISGLPLNVPIKVTARKIGYYSDRKTITLTDEESEKYLILDLQPFMGKSDKKVIDTKDKICTGCIIGGVLSTGFFPEFIKGAIVTLKGDNILTRIKTSGITGYFIFLNVPLGEQYTVTARHIRYKPESETVVLTKDEPIGIVSFYMYERDIKAKKSNIKVI